MTRNLKLNARQLALLERINGNTDPVTANEWDLACTVYALRDRKLVTTLRRDGIWVAEITDTGRSYLANGHYPEQIKPIKAKTSTRPQVDEITNDALLNLLVANMGRLQIPSPDRATRAKWRRAIHRVKQNNQLPDGHHLRHHGRDGGDLVIELVAGTHPESPPWTNDRPKVDLPDEPDRTHPLVQALDEDKAMLKVSQESYERTLRIVTALVRLFESRGHHLEWEHDGVKDLWAGIDSSWFQLSIVEEDETRGLLPTVDELESHRTYSWQRFQPQIASVPSARLRIQLPEDFSFSDHRRSWADRQRWRLENKLFEIVIELEQRAAIMTEKRIDAENKRVECRRQWEEAMTTARERFIDDFCETTLLEQVQAWSEAGSVNDYCDAIDALIETEQDSAVASELRSWSSWGRDYAKRRNPLMTRQLMPEVPEPEPDDLRSFLGKWDSYGPDESTRWRS